MGLDLAAPYAMTAGALVEAGAGREWAHDALRATDGREKNPEKWIGRGEKEVSTMRQDQD